MRPAARFEAIVDEIDRANRAIARRQLPWWQRLRANHARLLRPARRYAATRASLARATRGGR